MAAGSMVLVGSTVNSLNATLSTWCPHTFKWCPGILAILANVFLPRVKAEGLLRVVWNENSQLRPIWCQASNARAALAIMGRKPL